MEKRVVFFKQMVKYGLVGILNTLLTAVVIWILLYILSDKDSNKPVSALVIVIANFTGYLAGIINSFILNRNWTFKNKSNWKISLFRFLIAFAVCYCLQLGVVLWLNAFIEAGEWKIGFSRYTFIVTSAYICQLVGIVVYSVLNFLLNKYYTFQTAEQCAGEVNKEKQ